MAAYSPSIMAPDVTVQLPALGAGARVASYQVMLGTGVRSVTIQWSPLPPGMQLGPAGSIFVDNTENSVAVTVLFSDTRASTEIPAGEAVWLLALTASGRMTLSSPVTGDTTINVQVLNTLVSPSGVQTFTGSVSIVNPGPQPITPTDKSNTFAVGASVLILAANPARKFLFYQMPTDSDGYINAVGGAAGAGLGAYLQAGEKYESTGNTINTDAIHAWINAGAGFMPIWEG